MKEMQAAFDHKEVEKGKVDFWLENHYFEANRKENQNKPAFSMIIPPPNVTGILHIGHALDTTIIDIICRYKKLNGYDVLFLPAMDHAGIATQAKVEEKLAKEGKNKYEMGRDKFLLEAWKWKDEYAKYIRQQWHALGLSMDYTKERFTLDDKMNKVVNTVFKSLYDKELIYRGERIINWDPVLKTALSDVEVIYKEDKGKFYYFKYWFEDKKDFITIATTRPETMFGDQAVVVNNKDKRYLKFIGKKVINPANGELLEIIADSYVDPSFGTGAMKCTPASDPNDFEIAKRHNLKFVKTMNDDATMNNNCPKEYVGLDRYKCRKLLVENIKADGNLIKIEEITHNVGHSERSDSVVEPMLSKQWFVKMPVLAKKVMQIQKSKNKTTFFPSRFSKIFYQWLEKTNDWCISRQLWWGHQIPVYTDKKTGKEICSITPLDKNKYTQDSDVLDTWFSSALAPFAFLNWPDTNSSLYKRFFPLSLMSTGYDIIFFWVERMAIDGVEFNNIMPFKEVAIHGLVRDEQGRKMSKTLGNGIDPFKIIDEYGCDVLRYSLSTYGTPGLDINYSVNKIKDSRNFLNKIWNASRYVINILNNSNVEEGHKFSFMDKWIISRFNYTLVNVKKNMDKYELAQAANYLYKFIYDEFCSQYLEYSKVTLSLNDEELKKGVIYTLYTILKDVLVILFPFSPFISEEIYSYLPNRKKSIYEEEYPNVIKISTNKNDLNLASSISDAIKEIRNFKSTNMLAPNAPVKLNIVADKKTFDSILPYIKRFSFASEINLVDNLESNHFVVLPSFKFEAISSDTSKLEEKKKKRIEDLKIELEKTQKLLSNQGFLAKAPKQKVEEEKAKFAKIKEELESYLK